ncbi:MAG: MBL fold metallo-hydrolase [Rhodospirillaceae bacterium]|nr:MBL fold metallo-hydrolase [Rhodospirillaceae bacterium]
MTSERVVALPGPFKIQKVVEFEGPHHAPDFIFPDATPERFSATRAAGDPRLFDRESGKLVLSYHGILVTTERSRILIDTCMGNDKHRPRNPLWHMRSGPFVQDLAASGVKLSDIDYVFCTHLHGDHVGWNTRLVDGRWVPTFPRAKYLFARKEIEHWQATVAVDPEVNHRSWDDSVAPIFAAGQAVLVDEHHEFEPGVRLVPAPGHTPGNVMVRLEHKGQVAYVIGDTMHHPVQIERPEWSSKFCWDRTQSTQARKSLLESTADTGAWIIPAHFPTPTALRIESHAHGFKSRG